MGLRTASSRHSKEATAMAPALTEETTTAQTESFKLAPKERRCHPCLESAGREFYGDRDKTADDFCDVDDGPSPIYGPPSGGDDRAPLDTRTKASDFDFRNEMNDDLNHRPGRIEHETNARNRNLGDVEQLLNNFGTDLPPANVDDIMQVISSIDNGDDCLWPFEKQLMNDDDVMNMSIEDQQDEVENFKETKANELIAKAQNKLALVHRKLDFLHRRTLKLQARLMGRHVAGETAGVFEHVYRSLKLAKDDGADLNLPSTSSVEKQSTRPLSYSSAKALVRKMEATAAIQANSVAKQKQVTRYFGAGSIEPTALYRTSVSGLVALPPWSPEHKQDLQRVFGNLKSELRIVQSAVDSEATESSSGGESCDEFQNYNNQHQQYLSIQKRALWKYSRDRAAIGSRWTWLQLQISDLEYRIRQHTELHRKVRTDKGPLTLAGPSPPASPSERTESPQHLHTPRLSQVQEDVADEPFEYGCARTRALIHFRKRKLLQTGGLHMISRKAARPSTVRCGCSTPPYSHCALCTGRIDPMRERDPIDVLGVDEKVALVDSGYHPVFSMSEDISEGTHLEAIMRMPEWQQKCVRLKNVKAYLKNERIEHRSKKLEHRKKYDRLLKPSTISALSAKIRSKIKGRKARKRQSYQQHAATDDEEVASISGSGLAAGDNPATTPNSLGCSPSSSPLLHMQSIGRKNRVSSYDIDNIVIPYSVAASTRVEKLQYKEILTPKWRIADDAVKHENNKNNGTIKEHDDENDTEDLSEEATITRHDKCEVDERKKFLSYLKFPLGYGRTNNRSHKRTDSRAESSDTNTPDPMSPHQPDNNNQELTHKDTSPPVTPNPPAPIDESHMPSIAALRRRTLSRNVAPKEDDTTDNVEVVPPYDRREFPLNDETYEEMMKNKPEEPVSAIVGGSAPTGTEVKGWDLEGSSQVRANLSAQDASLDYDSASGGYYDSKVGSPGSESTESILPEEDPNDPEWIEVEKMSRERQKR